MYCLCHPEHTVRVDSDALYLGDTHCSLELIQWRMLIEQNGDGFGVGDEKGAQQAVGRPWTSLLGGAVSYLQKTNIW